MNEDLDWNYCVGFLNTMAVMLHILLSSLEDVLLVKQVFMQVCEQCYDMATISHT